MNYKKPFKLKDNFFLDVIWLYYTAVKLYISFKAFLKKKIGQKWVRKGIMIGLRMSWAPNNSLGQGSLPHAMLGQDGNMLLGLVRQNPLEALPTILSITLGSYRTQHHLEALAMPPPPMSWIPGDHPICLRPWAQAIQYCCLLCSRFLWEASV